MPDETLASYAQRCGWPCDLETGKFADMPERWYLEYIHKHHFGLNYDNHKLCLFALHIPATGYLGTFGEPRSSGISEKNPTSRQIREYARQVCTFIYGPAPLPKAIPTIDTNPPVTGLKMMVYAPIVCPGCMRQIQIPADGICPLCGTVVWRFQATGADDVR